MEQKFQICGIKPFMINTYLYEVNWMGIIGPCYPPPWIPPPHITRDWNENVTALQVISSEYDPQLTVAVYRFDESRPAVPIYHYMDTYLFLKESIKFVFLSLWLFCCHETT